MRNTFVKTLCEIGKENKDIYVLVADIGAYLFRDFPKERFINAGIAEQNMISIAAGLALDGKIPFCYTIASFITTRCYEQIKIDVCYQNLPVKIIGVGAGLCYSHEGATHHSLDDIALMNVLPNMIIYSPCSRIETEMATKCMINLHCPHYMRLPLDTNDEFVENELNLDTEIFVISTGRMVNIVNNAISGLDKVRLFKVNQLKPICGIITEEDINRVKLVITVEEHNVIGGLGSIISNFMTFHNCKARLIKIGVEDSFVTAYGSNEYVLEKVGLTANRIRDIINANR